MNIPRLLYEDNFWVFVLVTLVIGGGAAWLTGRAVALTWRRWWQAVVYALIIGAAVRFIHHALFKGTFASSHYYAVDAMVCLTLALLAFRITRTKQMARQYDWLIARNGLFRWAARPPENAGSLPRS